MWRRHSGSSVWLCWQTLFSRIYQEHTELRTARPQSELASELLKTNLSCVNAISVLMHGVHQGKDIVVRFPWYTIPPTQLLRNTRPRDDVDGVSKMINLSHRARNRNLNATCGSKPFKEHSG